MSFNDQNNTNTSGALNNNNNNNNNNNSTNNNNTNNTNLFTLNNPTKNNTDCKASQNNSNNFMDFDFNDCDIFGGNNHHMMGGANHHQQQSSLFFDQSFGGCGTTSSAPGQQGHIYFAPMKYGYLGQQEEQIFQDKHMNNIHDFEFGSSLFGTSNQNPYALNAVNSLNNTNGNQNNSHANTNNSVNNNNNNNNINTNSSNNNNNNFLANNLIFSNYNNNSALDLADLFPPETKLETKQSGHHSNNNNNYYMDNGNEFDHNGSSSNNNSSNHISSSSSQPPIITKTECNGNNCNTNTGLMSNNNNNMMGCNNFIGNTFNMNNNNGCVFGDRSPMNMIPQHNPYVTAHHHSQANQQNHYGMMNDHSNLSGIHPNQHMLGVPQMPSYHMAGNGIHSSVPMMHLNQQQQQPQNASIMNGNKNNVFSIVKDQQKDKKKDYDKNICRYITRQVVRSFSSPEFKNNVLRIISEIYPTAPSQNILSIYKDVTEFFLGEIENLSGFRALKDILVVNSDLDGNILSTQKKIFRDFMSWYLKERYFRNIISGNMKDKLAFIRYKNKIMLHYINKPHKWNSNKKKRLGKTSSPAHNSSNGVGSAPFSSVNLSKQEY